ncbi:AAA family ATPase [Cupriavidus necator]
MNISPTTISRIQVTGLHNQFNVALDLSPDLNIIFGRNGRGKTTLLHILANALEHDFVRFKHISFQNISIDTHEGASLFISKAGQDSNSPVVVRLNGELLTPVTENTNLNSKPTAPSGGASLTGAASRPVRLAVRSLTRLDVQIDCRHRRTAARHPDSTTRPSR